MNINSFNLLSCSLSSNLININICIGTLLNIFFSTFDKKLKVINNE